MQARATAASADGNEAGEAQCPEVQTEAEMPIEGEFANNAFPLASPSAGGHLWLDG